MSRGRKAGVGAAAIVFLLVASLVVSVLILIYRPLPTIEGDIESPACSPGAISSAPPSVKRQPFPFSRLRISKATRRHISPARPIPRIRSPRLANPAQRRDFIKQVMELRSHAKL